MPFLQLLKSEFHWDESGQDLCSKITRIMVDDEFLSKRNLVVPLMNHALKIFVYRSWSLPVPNVETDRLQNSSQNKEIDMVRQSLACEQQTYFRSSLLMLDSRVIIEIFNLNKCHSFSLFLSATLGGNFGLFLGMSILTLLELVDFALRRFLVFIWKES